MAASTETRGGLDYGWALGESGWNTGMDANLLKISRLAIGGLHVESRGEVGPSSDYVTGSAYIIGGTPAGAWADSDVGAAENDIIIWDGAAWVAYTPSIGWMCYIEDEEKIVVFKAAGWSSGVAI